MTTSLCFVNPETGALEFEDEETSERSLFVDSNSSSHWVPVADTNLLQWTKESVTTAFIEGKVTLEEYHSILEALLQEDAYNNPNRVKVSYVDVSDTPTENYESFLF